MKRAPALKHPGRWIWVLLLIPVAAGFYRLRLNVEMLDLLPRDIPAVQGLRLYQENFSDARELIVTLSGDNAEEVEAGARAIASRLRQNPGLASGVTWEPPWLEHPGGMAELMAYLWLNQPPEELAALAQRLAPSHLETMLQEAREQLSTSLSPQDIARLSYDPFGFTRLPESAMANGPSLAEGQQVFNSADGRFRVLFITSARDLEGYRDCRDWLTAIQTEAGAALNQEDLANHLRTGYTGRPAFVAEIGTGMERDMQYCVGGTALIIALLFWLAHRRLKPILWLLTLLVIVLAGTIGLGGLVYGTIHVISLGFAAILLGLAVDYAVVHYQEALAHPELSIPQIRHAIAPSIFWAALTTIAAFLVLNFGGLPGLGQVGTIVAIGVSLAALVMVYEFLPLLFPERRKAGASGSESSAAKAGPLDGSYTNLWSRLAVTIALLVSAVCVLLQGLPALDRTADPLRPRQSPAYSTLAEVQQQVVRQKEPLWLIVHGENEQAVAEDLKLIAAELAQAQAAGVIGGFTLPTAAWPNPANQEKNRKTAALLANRGKELREAATRAGFTDQALSLTENILKAWAAAADTQLYEPTNATSRWILEKFLARKPGHCYALGMVHGPQTPRGRPTQALKALQERLLADHAVLSGWELLGSAVFERVREHLWQIVAPMAILVLASLTLAFRRWREILLSAAVMAMSGVCLLAVMRIAGWSWNLLSLMSLPLILGTGVDYSIFVQLALRRYEGDAGKMRRSVGRALLLCGGTAVAGFGSLAVSSNAGMASLGAICATGIAGNMLFSIFLLPAWWQIADKRFRSAKSPSQNPSVLYSPRSWRLAMRLIRTLPTEWCTRLALLCVRIYWHVAAHRRAVVIHNLLPIVNGDRQEAEKQARRLFDQFAHKLVDLWRFEAGLPISELLGESNGWEHFDAAQQTGRGVLLVTPHFGNWEFGGFWLSQRGVTLQVITLAEPGSGFTELRKASRARWNIETVVIRNDPFAFLEIIRRLEAGATVALLVDRPPPPTGIEVQFFNRPFLASIAAAELARASGCAVLPVCVPRVGGVYTATILPPIRYERAALRDRAARQRLVQQMMSAFEPALREHPDQWFNFVPVWQNPAERASITAETGPNNLCS